MELCVEFNGLLGDGSTMTWSAASLRFRRLIGQGIPHSDPLWHALLLMSLYHIMVFTFSVHWNNNEMCRNNHITYNTIYLKTVNLNKQWGEWTIVWLWWSCVWSGYVFSRSLFLHDHSYCTYCRHSSTTSHVSARTGNPGSARRIPPQGKTTRHILLLCPPYTHLPTFRLCPASNPGHKCGCHPVAARQAWWCVHAYAWSRVCVPPAEV
jgi:hypothetical protein